jgi:hypothetical protein
MKPDLREEVEAEEVVAEEGLAMANQEVLWSVSDARKKDTESAIAQSQTQDHLLLVDVAAKRVILLEIALNLIPEISKNNLPKKWNTTSETFLSALATWWKLRRLAKWLTQLIVSLIIGTKRREHTTESNQMGLP